MTTDRVAAFHEIVAQNPGDAFARYGLAMEYKQLGQLVLALDQFDELEKQHPEYTAGYQMAAQLLMAEQRFPEAEKRLHAGIAAARMAGNQHAVAEMEGMLSEIEEQKG